MVRVGYRSESQVPVSDPPRPVSLQKSSKSLAEKNTSTHLTYACHFFVLSITPALKSTDLCYLRSLNPAKLVLLELVFAAFVRAKLPAIHALVASRHIVIKNAIAITVLSAQRALAGIFCAPTLSRDVMARRRKRRREIHCNLERIVYHLRRRRIYLVVLL